MAKVIVGMTVSLDGFVNDRRGSVERLYPNLAALAKTEMLREAIAKTGAVKVLESEGRTYIQYRVVK
jgi:hypothetical protein